MVPRMVAHAIHSRAELTTRRSAAEPSYPSSANHSDSSGLARSLALSFSRVAAARRIPVLPHPSSGIRDSSRAPDTRAGMTEKFDRADVRVTILCRTEIRSPRRALIITAQALETVMQHPARRRADVEPAPEIGGPAAARPHTARHRERRGRRIPLPSPSRPIFWIAPLLPAP